MSVDAWLPIGMEMPDSSRITSVSAEGPEWQIYAAKDNKRVLVVKDHLVSRWEDSNLVTEGAFSKLEFGDEQYFTLTSDSQHIVVSLENASSPNNKSEAMAFAQALRLTREIDETTSLHDGIYVEKLSRILPTYTPSNFVKDDVILGYYLSGGV